MNVDAPLTPHDMKDTIDVRPKKNIKRRMYFNKTVEKQLQERAEENKPFCNSCAMTDYEVFKEKHDKNNELRVRSGKPPVPLPEYAPDMESYTKRMKYLNTNTTSYKSMVDGTSAMIPVLFRNFKCDRCDGMQSIEQIKERKEHTPKRGRPPKIE